MLYMLAFLWFLLPLLCVASAATWALIARDNNRDLSFLSNEAMTRKTHKNWPLRLWATYNSGSYSFSSQIIINILFITALQLIYTIALHVAELFANLHRDEESWRRAGVLDTKAGVMVGKDSSIVAATAWPTVFLFVMKPVSHWIFGLSFPVDLQQEIKYHPLPLFVLTAIAVLLASFATYLAPRRPKGLQPSVYSSLDQLINMIDDWGGEVKSGIYWGDKSWQDGLIGSRRVGTSAVLQYLTEVKVDGQPYLGLRDDADVEKETMRRKVWYV